MSNSLALAGSDRLLILAPHPDDESIATGGLIQVARGVGAAVRVIVLTDGDNNPWPQRWI
jgi:N-acetyl-1-D-myo-inositol-2-amino-2-deoxy-alpha-D-glucopyranoside deacetylase